MTILRFERFVFVVVFFGAAAFEEAQLQPSKKKINDLNCITIVNSNKRLNELQSAFLQHLLGLFPTKHLCLQNKINL